MIISVYFDKFLIMQILVYYYYDLLLLLLLFFLGGGLFANHDRILVDYVYYDYRLWSLRIDIGLLLPHVLDTIYLKE